MTRFLLSHCGHWVAAITPKGTPPMHATQNPVGKSAEFHQTWQALMQQLERVLSLAHLRHPNRTETREAVSIAKHLLGKVGDRLDAATQD